MREDTRGRVLGAVEGGGELQERRLLPRRRPERHQRRGGAGLASEGPVHCRCSCCCSCSSEVSWEKLHTPLRIRRRHINTPNKARTNPEMDPLSIPVPRARRGRSKSTNDTLGCPKGSASLSRKNRRFLHALNSRPNRAHTAGRPSKGIRQQACHGSQPSPHSFCKDKVKRKTKQRRGRLNFAGHPCRISPNPTERTELNPTQHGKKLGAHGWVRAQIKKPSAGGGERRPGSIPDSSAPAFSLCGCRCCSLPIAARKSLSIQPGSGKEAADFALPSRGSRWVVEWRGETDSSANPLHAPTPLPKQAL